MFYRIIRSLRLDIEREIYAATVQLSAAREAYTQAGNSTDLAQKAREVAAARFEGGLSANLEVVSAQDALTATQSVAIRCLFEYYVARAKLARAEGSIENLFE